MKKGKEFFESLPHLTKVEANNVLFRVYKEDDETIVRYLGEHSAGDINRWDVMVNEVTEENAKILD